MTERTWANVRSALPAGLCADSVEIIRRATAPYRHEQRVIAAVKMAVAARRLARPIRMLQCSMQNCDGRHRTGLAVTA